MRGNRPDDGGANGRGAHARGHGRQRDTGQLRVFLRVERNASAGVGHDTRVGAADDPRHGRYSRMGRTPFAADAERIRADVRTSPVDGPAAVPTNDGTVAGMARDWMRSMAASQEHTTRMRQHLRMPTFPVVGEMNGYFPEVSARTFPLAPREPVEVLMATCGCLFAPLHLLKRVVVPLRDFVVADYALDWILSNALWSHRIPMLAPACSPPLVRVERARNSRPPAWKSKEMLMRILKSEGEKYAEFAGVDLSEGQCFGRGRMGLLPDMSDILVKFGSQASFDRVKRMFT